MISSKIIILLIIELIDASLGYLCMQAEACGRNKEGKYKIAHKDL